MTKRELLNKMESLLKEKGMEKIESSVEKIDSKSSKDVIENAISCLEATDEKMNDCLTVIKLAYPKMYEQIVKEGNWLTHSHNRYFVYFMAKMVIMQGR